MIPAWVLLETIKRSGGRVMQMKDFPDAVRRVRPDEYKTVVIPKRPSPTEAVEVKIPTPLNDNMAETLVREDALQKALADAAMERGRASRDAHSHGSAPGFVKHDAGKLRMDLLQPRALEATAEVLTHGARKYSPLNWRQGADWSRYYGALQRHLNAWWAGERKDKDSGLDHLAHAACCLMFLQSYELEGLGTDDRPMTATEVNARNEAGPPVDHNAYCDDKVTQRNYSTQERRARYAGIAAARKGLRDVLEVMPNKRIFHESYVEETHRKATTTCFSLQEGRAATIANQRLVPKEKIYLSGYRYESASGRVMYLVACQHHNRATAIGAAVLQPGDVEDRAIGLQIAVGQALKNFNRRRYLPYWEKGYPALARSSDLIVQDGHPDDCVENWKTLVPLLAEREIVKADDRKAVQSALHASIRSWFDFLQTARRQSRVL